MEKFKLKYKLQPQKFVIRPLIIVLLLAFSLTTQAFTGNNAARAADESKLQTGSDGTLQVYELRGVGDTADNCRKSLYRAALFASSDGGRTWQERGQQFDHNIVSVVATPADAKAVYVLVADSLIVEKNRPTYSIYFSGDAGQTWEKRYQGGNLPIGGCGADTYNFLYNLRGYGASVNVVGFGYLIGLGGSSGSNYLYLASTDGGRSFNEMGDENTAYHHLDFYYTPEGIVRYYNREKPYLKLSTDGGKSWQNLNYPDYNPDFSSCGSSICGETRMTYLVGQFFIYSKVYNIKPEQYEQAGIFYSTDNGRTWRKVASGLVNLEFSYTQSYTATAKDKNGNKVNLEFGDLDRFRTMPVGNNGANSNLFFLPTGHNLSGPFKAFWESHGGLAQFGYPKTETFYEYNPADGKTYLVQYFERNRFEYHPENAGTAYEVLLGLLGNQLTAERRAKGEGGFNRFEDMHYPGGTYFPQTGHNLRNSFKEYWARNGGLAIYGYPISEEFEEVNPDDGKTYVVQYFERNRFEWHPENKGTQYEVLLGLLGNTLLKQRGWL